jgi:putative ABC transport system permease protein
MPFGSFHVPPMSVPGSSEIPNINGQPPFMYGATPAFLRMMDVKLRAGRLIDEGDKRGAPSVVLINETMAREVWPTENALGKCIRIGHDPSLPQTMLAPPTLPCRVVIGIVRDSRARSLRPDGREASLMQFYVPFEQLPPLPFQTGHQVNGLLVQASGDPRALVGAVQRAVQRNSAVPVFANVRPYQDLLSRQLRPWQLGATLFSAFGALALAIAAVGLFAVIAYVTNEQTRALGIRLALGAGPAVVRRLVITGALKLVTAGLVAGVLAALILGRFTQDLLFQTSARDPAVISGAVGCLLLVTIVAAALPSLRAGRVSPLVAFRAE